MPAAIRYPADLPITSRRDEIVAAIRRNQVVILAGETGSGKTTQLPKMCLEAAGEGLRGRIGCTQPRRVAAMSVSRRVAEELAVPWGREVGCKMRFQDDTSRATKVKFMTDGILLAEIQGDPLLREYSMIILDEAHERSLNIDFLLGCLKRLLPRRPDLKVLVTSATIDTAAFSRHFDDAPIIEVSGRLYPVDIRYAPFEDDEDEPHFVDAAVAKVEELLLESEAGDALVFMPTERDIRDACDLLAGRLGSGVEVLPLFGRMASADQQRIFAPGRKRRVVVATNVAETSITIPRIRFVVDTGLARISRYNARTRTKRLPVEPVSQSSANQRAGRAGRVQDGVCVRLFSEGDFENRPRFTMPEIQRANLAEVILRMKAFNLGEIDDFPFIDPPTQAAIRGGYGLLHELGSLTDSHELTPLGRELARLPIDPTLARMLVQARREGCLPEMLVIASGLSIPDPRERPEEKRELADAAHKAFAAPDSDFLTLLRIWEAAPDPESGSRNALRKFCKAGFLSFIRMLEWRDLWRQLREMVQEDDGRRERGTGAPGDTAPAPPSASPSGRQRRGAKPGVPSANPRDDAIHRSILAGQLGHIAMREDRNTYKAGGNRLVTLFPGSNLYERRERRRAKGTKGQPAGPEAGPRQPPWIVAGEIVHTSQVFARMVARIDPSWAAELGAHLCQHRYSEPHWSPKAGRVLVTQRSLLHGLEVDRRRIDYGRIDPAGATQVFIRGALIEGESPLPHRFDRENRALRERIETALTRVRSNRVYGIEERLFQFYAGRLHGISSLHDLNRRIREQGENDLVAGEDDLVDPDDASAPDLAQFPERVTIANAVLPVAYAYAPGEEEDGVTVRVPLPVVDQITPAEVQWMVPGLRQELAEVLLRALPKALRRRLMPIEPKAREIAREWSPGREPFLEGLAAHVTRRYRIDVSAGDFPPEQVPDHLRPRIEILDESAKPVAAGRDLDSLRAGLRKAEVRSDRWDRVAAGFERYGVTGWTFGDLPESITVGEVAGAPLPGFPGLDLRDGEVDVRLFRRREDAERATPAAVRRLAELALGRDIAWLWKELRGIGDDGPPAAKPAGNQPRAAAMSFHQALDRLAMPPAKGGPPAAGEPPAPDQLRHDAQEHILAHLLRLRPLRPLTEARFRAMCEAARKELPMTVHRVRELVGQIQALRRAILASPQRYRGLEGDLDRLSGPGFLARTPHERLPHLVRYLKGVQVRAERATHSPAKDAAKAAALEPFADWETRVPGARREEFHWMLEEFRVSIFAQELGTAHPVSAKRLEAMMEC